MSGSKLSITVIKGRGWSPDTTYPAKSRSRMKREALVFSVSGQEVLTFSFCERIIESYFDLAR